jgi:hypothetical protein
VLLQHLPEALANLLPDLVVGCLDDLGALGPLNSVLLGRAPADRRLRDDDAAGRGVVHHVALGIAGPLIETLQLLPELVGQRRLAADRLLALGLQLGTRFRSGHRPGAVVLFVALLGLVGLKDFVLVFFVGATAGELQIASYH